MQIILFRHGDKQHIESSDFFERRSVTLSKEGIKEVMKLANSLKLNFKELIGLSHLYSSPYPRAIQSAEIVRNILDIDGIKIVKCLEEFYAHADYTKPKTELEELQKKSLVDIDFRSPHTSSTFREFILQVLEFFEELYKEGEKFVLVSAHGNLIRNLVYYIDVSYRPTDDEIFDSKHKGAGYSVLEFDGKDYIVNEFNKADHL